MVSAHCCLYGPTQASSTCTVMIEELELAPYAAEHFCQGDPA